MVRKGIVMKVYKGFHEEYQRRHSQIWPEMVNMIHEYGAKNYSIFLDKKTNTLFGYIEIEDEEKWNKSSETEICQKWWAYMKDIMKTNADNSPVSVDLKEVFHMD
ncbi:L-rhamnose mutarotase [Clostridium scatologenes]|uniref:L-rhamnose mutarotase n=1 Tax=Clostridium scatologenes TaxID=1548 RepID=A0A0E3JRB2_CLOSL|nr:L-rhamnose mutarotase [Clostridium scatologenes]AKA71579.1 L-rhamnose 1-epimerase [Clostridium scatologenes]